MDNKYIRQLKKSKGKVRRKLYAAIALILTATVMVSSVSYAWLVLSRNPEVTGVSTTIGSNGNLEIALATSEHLDGKIAQVPVTVAGYGTDGRLDVFDLDNLDLEKSGLGAIYNTQTARCDFGSVTLPRTDLEAGLLDQEEMLESILDNTSYGLRLAGPMKYSGSYDEESDNVTVDFYVDGYCFAVDMLLRTNASVANLMLQTEATQRMESQLEEEYQGQGSFIQLENPYMTAAMSVVIPSLVTDMSNLFRGCSKLTRIRLTGVDTSAVTNMNSMFRNCLSLTSLDLSGFDTSKVTDMGYMFAGPENRYSNSADYSKLAQLDISGWDMSKVTLSSGMFDNCPAGNKQ